MQHRIIRTVPLNDFLFTSCSSKKTMYERLGKSTAMLELCSVKVFEKLLHIDFQNDCVVSFWIICTDFLIGTIL